MRHNNGLALAISTLIMLSLILVGCAPASVTPTAAPVEQPTEAPTQPVVAPTEAPAAAEGPVLGGKLRVARVADVTTWDPQFQDENDSLWAGIQIYSALLKVSSDGMSLDPFLAETWKANSDYTEFTFNLYPDAEFCDGTPITSGDVKFSFDRATTSAAVSWMVPAGMTIETPDEHTVVIKLEAPNVALPWWVTLWGMQVVSQKYGESHTPEEMANNPLGSGVFCLAEWKKGDFIRLVPNEHSWLKDTAGNTLPYVDEVTWSIVPDANNRVLQIEAGEIDVAMDPPFSEIKRLDALDGISSPTAPSMGEATIWLNQRTCFKDPLVRQAANYAVDKESLIDIVLQGYGLPAYSFLYLGKYTNEAYGFRYDLGKAKELMGKSTCAGGFDAELLIVAGDSVMQETAVVLKEQLAEIGINVTITPLESGTFFERWFAGDFDMLYKLSTLDIYDSSENLNIDINDAGFTGWKDPELWKFAQAASAEPNETKRAQMFDELQKRYMEAPPQLPLFHPVVRWAQADYVNGFQILNTNLHPFYYTWLAPH